MSRYFFRREKILVWVWTVFAALSMTALSVFAEGWPETEPGIASDCGCLIDGRTGVVLFDKNKDEARHPASITKVLTVLLALENGNLEDSVSITEEAAAYAVYGSANQKTKTGEVFTLEQLIYGTLLGSANDMATAIGVYIGGGSLDVFLDMMNGRAAELGCRDTHFANACGMPNEEHHTTAHDMALIMQEAMKREDYRKIINTHVYVIPPTNMTASERQITSHDPLLVSPDYFYPGIIGGKTGNTDAAGHTLVNAVERNGMQLICVTLHATSAPSAAYDHIDLLNYGYANFTNVEAVDRSLALSGNILTVPCGVAAKDCSVARAVEEVDGERRAVWTYSYGGRTVGRVVLTEENASALIREENSSVEESEESLSETAIRDASNSKEHAAGGIPENAARIIIRVFAAMILIGCLLIGITVIAREIRKSLRRKRKMKMRKQRPGDRKKRGRG
ncbi:MAG: D-alanyl-D-alanine carboxypeptidase [Lachnospiraceae bacterium]|nr:D-alanyl-D-alanine carboxypeptidase [Lachnospiraceae bacterium]